MLFICSSVLLFRNIVQWVDLLKIAHRPFSKRVIIKGLKQDGGSAFWNTLSMVSFCGFFYSTLFTLLFLRFIELWNAFLAVSELPRRWFEFEQEIEIISTTLVAFSPPKSEEVPKDPAATFAGLIGTPGMDNGAGAKPDNGGDCG